MYLGEVIIPVGRSVPPRIDCVEEVNGAILNQKTLNETMTFWSQELNTISG